jgi:hypothetical protein
MLTRADLEQKRDRAYTVVDVPHPDPARAASGERIDIRLRNMFGGEWISLMRSMHGDSKGAEWRSENYTQLVLAFCLVDEQGKRILQDDDLNAAWWKSQSKGFVIDAIDAAMRFSNLNSDSSVEGSRKNSLPTGDSCKSTELPQGLDIEPPAILSTTLD